MQILSALSKTDRSRECARWSGPELGRILMAEDRGTAAYFERCGPLLPPSL